MKGIGLLDYSSWIHVDFAVFALSSTRASSIVDSRHLFSFFPHWIGIDSEKEEWELEVYCFYCYFETHFAHFDMSSLFLATSSLSPTFEEIPKRLKSYIFLNYYREFDN